MPKQKNEPVSMTESQLKAEILKQRAEQARIDALKKPPSPRKAKADNFWYHYKYHTIGGAIALCLVVFFVRDMVFRTRPDATIELATSRYISGETMEALQAALAERIPDHNGDGKVYISVDYIQLSEATVSPETAEAEAVDPASIAPMGSGEAEYASVMKFSAILASNSDPLFLVDDGVYEYILRMGTNEDGTVESIFEPQTEIPAADGERLPLSATALADVPGLEELDGLAFCLRTSMKTGEKDVAYQQYCAEMLKTLAATA